MESREHNLDGENERSGKQAGSGDEFIARSKADILRMSAAAEAMADTLGLPPEAKYDVIDVLYGPNYPEKGH